MTGDAFDFALRICCPCPGCSLAVMGVFAPCAFEPDEQTHSATAAERASRGGALSSPTLPSPAPQSSTPEHPDQSGDPEGSDRDGITTVGSRETDVKSANVKLVEKSTKDGGGRA